MDYGHINLFVTAALKHLGQPILCDAPIRESLHNAIILTRVKRPFTIDAWVLLPDHLHGVWTLPPDDADFSTRWSIITRQVSVSCREVYRRTQWITGSKQKHRESALWQRRYWEHQIRDDTDYIWHVDYIHYNPIKHKVCRNLADWPFSTFHRYVEQGIYPANWGGNGLEFDAVVGE